jgi:HSP20 family molecular chaperone IbpA
MDTTNATSDTRNGRTSGSTTGSTDPVVEKKGRIGQPIPRRIVLPQSVRQSFDHLVARTWPRLQTLAMRARLRVPRLSQVAVTRSDEQLEVQVDLPGVEPADVEVAIQGSAVTIRSARQRQRENRTKDHYRLDRYREVFERSIPLDLPVDADKASATLKYGVLQVRLPNGKDGNAKAKALIAVRTA